MLRESKRYRQYTWYHAESEITTMEFYVFILVVIIIVWIVWGIGYMIDSRKVYSDNELRVRRENCEQDNSYYFVVRLKSWQHKKKRLLANKYSQNTIIYCEEDGSYHRIMRWGANVNGWQRIIAEPYIFECRYVINNYYIIANQSSVCIERASFDSLNALYREIDKRCTEINLEEKTTLLDTINCLQNKKVVKKKMLESLHEFLVKNADMLSAVSDICSIISVIAEMIQR